MKDYINYQFNIQVKMKNYKPQTNWLGGFAVLLLCGNLASLIYVCSSISQINAKFVQPEIFKKFPQNQMELTMNQFLSIVENVHKISSRIEPVHGVAFIGDLKTIVERVSNLLERNTTDALMDMVRQINKIPMKVVAESLANLDLRKLNDLAESTRLIEEKLNKLHEIKIQI